MFYIRMIKICLIKARENLLSVNLRRLFGRLDYFRHELRVYTIYHKRLKFCHRHRIMIVMVDA